MGNSVGFYAVADQLQAGRVGIPAMADFDLPTAETGAVSRNVQRLSVTTISAECDVPSQLQVTHSECVNMEAATSTQSLISMESGQCAGSCPEVPMDQEAEESEGQDGDEGETILPWRTSDRQVDLQVSVDTEQVATESERIVDVEMLTSRLICEETYDNNELKF